METDGPLKILFRRYPQDLLRLTGDLGATVQASGPVEIHGLQRRVDCVLELRRKGDLYYRHVEFQAEPDPGMAVRVFRYNSQLFLQYGAPVLTTVIYLFPPKPKHEPVLRVVVGGQEYNRWSFQEVFLWEIDAKQVLAEGAPGLLALVPLMGGRDEGMVRQAVRQIAKAFPQERLSDAEDVLLALAGRLYSFDELERIVGRDRMIQSSLYTEGRAEGLAEGEARGRAEGRAEGATQGRLEAEQELCAALTRKYHPSVAERALPSITSCRDAERLKQWALAAPDLSDAEFLRLIDS